MPVLRAKRNLKMHLVPPFTSQIHNPMPITFFSEYTTKAKTIMQGINTDSFLTVRLVKEKKKEFAVPENGIFITRMTGGGQLTICHWFPRWVGSWKRCQKVPFKSKNQWKLSTIMRVLPVAQGIQLFYAVWKQVEASVSLLHLVDSHHHWQQWGWIRYLHVCRQKRKYIFNQETEITYQVLEKRLQNMWLLPSLTCPQPNWNPAKYKEILLLKLKN